MKRWDPFAIPIMLLSLVSSAEGSEKEYFLKKGLEALRQRDWAYAEGNLQMAVGQDPFDPDARFFLGVALHHQGQYSKSVAELTRAIDGRTRHLPRALYYRAMAYAELGQQEKAKLDFQRILQNFFFSPEAQKVREAVKRQLEMPKTEAPQKQPMNDVPKVRIPEPVPGVSPWTTFLSQSISYDSNVLLDSSDRYTVGKEDLISQTLLYTRWNPRATPRWAAHYSGFLTRYQDQDQLDSMGNSGGGSYRQELGSEEFFEVGYRYTHLALDDNPFQHVHNLTGMRQFQVQPLQKIWLSSEVQHRDFRGARYDPLDSDGFLFHLGSVWNRTQEAQTTGQITAGIEDADHDYQDFQVVEGMARSDHPLPWRDLRNGIQFSLREHRYGATHPSFGKRRRDVQWQAGADFLKPISEHLLLELDLKLEENRSNIDWFHYRKKIVSLQLSLEF
jgi:tetratricopeptide (TPR) repeat protein